MEGLIHGGACFRNFTVCNILNIYCKASVDITRNGAL